MFAAIPTFGRLRIPRNERLRFRPVIPAKASLQTRHSREGGNPAHGDVEDKNLTY